MSDIVLEIKVCGMRDPENIREILKLKPNYMGFIFYPHSKRYVGKDFSLEVQPETFGECKRVGVFVNQSLEEIDKAIARTGLHVLQLHGEETPEFCRKIRAKHPEQIIWKSFQIGENFDFKVTELYEGVADAFVFDTPSPLYGGSGTSFDWSYLGKYIGSTPFMLAGGVGVDNAGMIRNIVMNAFHIFAIDLNSKVEVSPGIKSPTLINQTLEIIRT